jgi:hypothetical protein
MDADDPSQEESRKRQKPEEAEEALRQRVAALEASLAEANQRAAISSGNYYSTIQEVWEITVMSCDGLSIFELLKRERAPGFFTRTANKAKVGPDVYNLTKTAADEADNDVAVDSARSFGYLWKYRLRLPPRASRPS